MSVASIFLIPEIFPHRIYIVRKFINAMLGISVHLTRKMIDTRHLYPPRGIKPFTCLPGPGNTTEKG